MSAFERYDMASLVTLLHEDAVQSMPPFAMWIEGAQDITTWMVQPGPSECRDRGCCRSRPTAAPGTGSTAATPRRARAWALQVLEISGDRIAGMRCSWTPAPVPRLRAARTPALGSTRPREHLP